MNDTSYRLCWSVLRAARADLSTIALFFALIGTLTAFARPTLAQVSIGSASQLSIGKDGQVPSGTSGSPVLAANSSLVAFRSGADNLVESDTNNASDVFLRNLSSGEVKRLSVSTAGVEGNNDSNQPTISAVAADGFFAVGFTTLATNLGSTQDSGFDTDVAVRLPTLNYTEVLSVNAEGELGNDDSNQPSIAILPAPNRVLVAYASKATNLVDQDTNGVQNIFLATLTAPSTLPIPELSTLLSQRLLTTAANGSASNGESDEPRISGNGRYVVFSSRATNLLAGQTTSGKQIFMIDLRTGARTLVSKSSSGSSANANCAEPSISYNGRYIAYTTSATNVVAGNSAGRTVVVAYDTLLATSQQVNVTSAGTVGNGAASDPVLSPNGRFVSFSDSSTNLLGSGDSADRNNLADVFVKDLQTGVLVRVSQGQEQEADGVSDTTYVAGPSYNSLQALLSYRSFATNLTSASTASGAGDIFLNAASIDAPTLAAGTRLEVPADLSLTTKRRVLVQLQEFSEATLESFPRLPDLMAAETRKTKVRYEVRIEGLGNRKRERIKQISRRNQVTSRKLKPGKYTVTYKASVPKSSTNSTPVSSSFSPRQRFEVS